MRRTIVVFSVLAALLLALTTAYAVENSTWGRIKATFSESDLGGRLSMDRSQGYRTEELNFIPLTLSHTGNDARVAKPRGRKKGRNARTDATTYVEELITKKDGGQLKLDYEAKDHAGNTACKVQIDLKIEAGALKKDSMISISLLEAGMFMTNVDVVFGQHGIRFRKPAYLVIDAQYLDLSGIEDPDEVGFYSYNQKEDLWYEIPTEELKVELADPSNQKLLVKAWLDHFSRYALGRSRR